MSEQKRPNIVLICADQWRGDCLGAAGHPAVETPYLDDMCLYGTRFTAAYSATPSCISARAALMTGLSQRSHGRVSYEDSVTWNYETYLADEFTRHGYQTQAIGKMHVFPERSQCGFQNVILHDGYLHASRARGGVRLELNDDYIQWLREKSGNPTADYFDHGLNCNGFVVRPWDKAEELHPTNYITTQAVDFLRRRDTRKPFFLYLSYHRPHPPLDPPAWALEQYLDKELPPPPCGAWSEQFSSHHTPQRSDLFSGRLTPQKQRRAQAGYYGSMTHIDHQLNRLREAIIDYGLLGETIFCFTSDHGEMLGDHDLYRKGVAYEGSAKIPLVFRGPGIPMGNVSGVPAELRDLMPTLLDLAGLPIPEVVEGESLVRAMQGERDGFKSYIHGEHGALGQAMQWLTDGEWKYIWLSNDGIEQLFNLKSDPQELYDLAAAEPQKLAEWRGRLIEELTGREEGFVEGGKLVCGRPYRASLSHIRTV
jgi:arylsulfatase A-like enzyme